MQRCYLDCCTNQKVGFVTSEFSSNNRQLVLYLLTHALNHIGASLETMRSREMKQGADAHVRGMGLEDEHDGKMSMPLFSPPSEQRK